MAIAVSLAHSRASRIPSGAVITQHVRVSRRPLRTSSVWHSVKSIWLIRFSRAPYPACRGPICSPEQRRGKGVEVRERELGPLVPPPRVLSCTQPTTLAADVQERRSQDPDEPKILSVIPPSPRRTGRIS